MKKSTDAEIEIRVAKIYQFICKGFDYTYMVRHASKEWKISSRQLDTYILKAKEQIRNTYGEDYKKTILSNHLAQLEDLYIKNYSIEDFRECRTIIESRNKLLGLNEATKIEISEKPIFKQIDLDVKSNDSAD